MIRKKCKSKLKKRKDSKQKTTTSKPEIISNQKHIDCNVDTHYSSTSDSSDSDDATPLLQLYIKSKNVSGKKRKAADCIVAKEKNLKRRKKVETTRITLERADRRKTLERRREERRRKAFTRPEFHFTGDSSESESGLFEEQSNTDFDQSVCKGPARTKKLMQNRSISKRKSMRTKSTKSNAHVPQNNLSRCITNKKGYNPSQSKKNVRSLLVQHNSVFSDTNPGKSLSHNYISSNQNNKVDQMASKASLYEEKKKKIKKKRSAGKAFFGLDRGRFQSVTGVLNIDKSPQASLLLNDSIVTSAAVSRKQMLVDKEKREDVDFSSFLRFGFAGLTSGFLSGLMGIGGGIVMTSFLSLMTEMTQHEAVATSLVALVPTGLSATYHFHRKGHVRIRLVVLLSTASATGMFIAAHYLADQFDESNLRRLFACIVGFSGLRLFL
eukprot:g6398.t1